MSTLPATNGVTRWTGVFAAAFAAVSVIGSMLAWIYNLQDRVTKMEVSQNEIETQFCSQDIVRNLMHANDLRNIALLWKQTFGIEYPINNAFYPTICNRRIKQ